jgi:hypothetical protein
MIREMFQRLSYIVLLTNSSCKMETRKQKIDVRKSIPLTSRLLVPPLAHHPFFLNHSPKARKSMKIVAATSQ